MASRYHEVYDSWKRDPQAFWAAAAEDIDWFQPLGQGVRSRAGVYGRWFTGAAATRLTTASTAISSAVAAISWR